MKSYRVCGGIVFWLILAFNIRANVLYVDVNSFNSMPPYTNWSTAAANIQDAVDAALEGDFILVSNGVYQTGGRIVDGAMSNRLAVTKAVQLQGVNGPEVTSIVGYQLPGTKNGSNAVRCVYLASGARLAGFTVRNGATMTNGNIFLEQSGGGVWCASSDVILSNCIIAWNTANYSGGGVYHGTLNNCLLSNNAAGSYGGGSYMANLNSCVVSSNSAYSGGGSYTFVLGHTGTLNNCIVSRNVAVDKGGGSSGGYLNNCLIMNNKADPLNGLGGGVFSSVLTNCTVVSNSAYVGGGIAINSSAYNVTLVNSIIYFNLSQGRMYDNYYYGPFGGFLNFKNCCTTPGLNVLPNVTNAPFFLNPASGDYRLQSSSLCINAGDNVGVGVANDLAGNPRIVGGRVDMGAYEYQSPSSILSYAWAQHYGLPRDGTADFTDPDGDGMNNWQECYAGTIPTNALSLLRITAISNDGSGIVVAWQSVGGTTYFLQCSTNLATQPAFSTIQSDIPGGSGTTIRNTGIPAANNVPHFYRVGVQ